MENLFILPKKSVSLPFTPFNASYASYDILHIDFSIFNSLCISSFVIGSFPVLQELLPFNI